MTKTKTEPAKTPLEEVQEADAVDFWEEWGGLGPGKQVAVCREPGRVWLALIPLDEDFGPELVKDRWGGGRFSFRARENGKFMKGYPTQHVEIEGAPKLQLPQVVEDTPEVMALRTKLAELTGDESQPAKVADNVMLALVGMMAPVLTAIVSSAMDRPQQASPVEILDLARKLSKDAREAAPNPDGFMDPIERLGLPLLGEIRELRKIEAAKNGASEETPEAKEPEAAPVARVPSTMQELADFVADWCAPHVTRGASPSLRAEVLLEDLAIQNPPLMAQVINLARLDDVLDHWGRMVPSVAASKEWHGEFISEIRRFADEADAAQAELEAVDDKGAGIDAPVDPEGGRGNAGDGEAHGETSEAGGEG